MTVQGLHDDFTVCKKAVQDLRDDFTVCKKAMQGLQTAAQCVKRLCKACRRRHSV